MAQRKSRSRSTGQKPRNETEPASPSPPSGPLSTFFRVFTQHKYYKRGAKKELCYRCRLCNDSGVYVHGWMTEWSLVMHESSSLKHLGMFKVFEKYVKVVEEVKCWARLTKIKQVFKEKSQDVTGRDQLETQMQQGKQNGLELLSNAQEKASMHAYEQAQALSQGDRFQLLERLVELALNNPTPHIPSDLIAACTINWTLRSNAIKGLEWAAGTLLVGEASTESFELGTRLEPRGIEHEVSCKVAIEPLCETGSETCQVEPVPRRPRPTSLSVILNPSSSPHRSLPMEVAKSVLKLEHYEWKEGNGVLDTKDLADRSKSPDASLVDGGGSHHKQSRTPSSTSTPDWGSPIPSPNPEFKQRFGESCESIGRLGSGLVSDLGFTLKAEAGNEKDYIGCVWCGRPNTPTRGNGTCSRGFSMHHHDELILDL